MSIANPGRIEINIQHTINARRGQMTMVTWTMSARCCRYGYKQNRQVRLTPIADDGGQLETQAFAERGGRLKKHIMTLNHCRDDLSLQWTGAKSTK